MSTRRRSKQKHISSGRKNTRRLSHKGGNEEARLAFAHTHHLAHQISSQITVKATQSFDRANDELATAIQEGIKRGRQIYKDVSEAPAREVGEAIDQKAEALREQGKDAAAKSVEDSKEMAEEEVQTALRAIAQKEIGFVENMTVATAAEVVSEVPGVGPLAGEAIEGVYNQGKAVFDAKADFDEKMEGIREKAAALEAKKAKLVGLTANPQNAVPREAEEAKAALQKEIDGHKAKLSKHYDELALLEKRLEEEVQKFRALARDSRIKVYDNINRLNNLVVQSDNPKLADEWKNVLASLEACMETEDPEERKHRLKDFEEKLRVVKELGDKQSEFEKLASETSSILEQGLDLHHGSNSKPKSKGGKGATKKKKLQSRRQILSEARKRLRKGGLPV